MQTYAALIRQGNTTRHERVRLVTLGASDPVGGLFLRSFHSPRRRFGLAFRFSVSVLSFGIIK